jgi:hypothetical protein
MASSRFWYLIFFLSGADMGKAVVITVNQQLILLDNYRPTFTFDLSEYYL